MAQDPRLSCLDLILPKEIPRIYLGVGSKRRISDVCSEPTTTVVAVLGRHLSVPRGWRVNSHHLILPDLRDPRFLFPARPNHVLKSSIALYQPGRGTGRFARRLFELSAPTGLLSRLPFSTVSTLIRKGVSKARSPLETELESCLGSPPAHLAISTGTPGLFRKVSVRVMDDNGKPIAYVKLGASGRAAERIRAETAILQRVSGLALRSVRTPKLIVPTSVGSWEALIEEHVASDGPASSATIDSEFVANLHVELHRSTAAQGLLVNGRFWQEMANRVRRGTSPDSTSQLLQQTLSVIGRQMQDRSISLGLAHRDIATWNFLTAVDRVTLIDWEMALDGAPTVGRRCVSKRSYAPGTPGNAPREAVPPEGRLLTIAESV